MEQMRESWTDERLDDGFDHWQHLLLSFMGSLLIGLLTLFFAHL
ncbi:MAG TPA: hypothetical protein VJ989_01565 [Solirubrobacterales bacterium]|nr:hypothetical protein [Solirubrobacterales bacterium]